MQISVEGAVTAVKHIADSHDATGLNTGRAEVLYGTHNGILGQLFLDHMTIKNGWKMKSTSHKGGSSGCTSGSRPVFGHICAFLLSGTRYGHTL